MASVPRRENKGLREGQIAPSLNERMSQGRDIQHSTTEGFKDMNERMKQPAQGSTGPAKDLAGRMKQGGGTLKK